MMKLQKTLVIVLAIVMVCAGAAWAGQHGMGHHKMGSPGMGHDGKGQKDGNCPFKMLRGLDLTEAQTDQIIAVFNKYEKEHDAIRQEMREARKTLREAVHTDEINEADIRAAAKQLGDQKGELAIQQARMYSEIRPILTEDQRQQLKEMKTNRWERKECRQRLHKAIRDYRDIEE